MLLPAGLRGHSAPAVSSALPAPLGGRGGALLLRGPGGLFLGLLVLPGLLPRRGVGPGGLLFPAAVPPVLLGGAAGPLLGQGQPPGGQQPGRGVHNHIAVQGVGAIKLRAGHRVPCIHQGARPHAAPPAPGPLRLRGNRLRLSRLPHRGRWCGHFRGAASPAAPKPVPSAPVSVPVRTYTPDIPSVSAPRSPVPAPEAPVSPAVPAAPVEKNIPAPETAAETVPEQTVLDEAFRAEPVRYIGEALNVYILLEQGDKMLLIDKHAAHERILFDKMRLNEKPLMPQELLEPQPFNTDPDGAALLEANAALLARLGFELDAFGDTAFLIRAVPAQLDAASAVPLLEELVEKLREGKSLSASDVWERLAATVACKAAIKGGWVTEREELLSLAEKVLAGEVTHCPHGRPVMTVFTRAELDKRFGRIV